MKTRNFGGRGYPTPAAKPPCAPDAPLGLGRGFRIESRGRQSAGECCRRKRLKTSIFEIFKIGVGPSSSHTVGPMRAARRFALDLKERRLLVQVVRVRVELFGSLALTGHGHQTDRAVLLGLSGEEPDKIDPATIYEKVGDIRQRRQLKLLGEVAIPFHEDSDLLFLKTQTLPGHSNGMRYTAFDLEGGELYSAIFYSVGGGFVVREGEESGSSALKQPPFPFASADALLEIGEREKRAIWQIVLENEKTWRDEAHLAGDASMRPARAGDRRRAAWRIECAAEGPSAGAQVE